MVDVAVAAARRRPQDPGAEAGAEGQVGVAQQEVDDVALRNSLGAQEHGEPGGQLLL